MASLRGRRDESAGSTEHDRLGGRPLDGAVLSKKRIHQLAKEYGMAGKDLAAKLRDLGFSHVKSHMTALDEFEVLQVQAVLEAHGIISETRSESEEDKLGGGLVVRKKKKKKAPSASEQPADSAAEAPPEQEPEATVAQAPAVEAPAEVEAEVAGEASSPQAAEPAAQQALETVSEEAVEAEPPSPTASAGPPEQTEAAEESATQAAPPAQEAPASSIETEGEVRPAPEVPAEPPSQAEAAPAQEPKAPVEEAAEEAPGEEPKEAEEPSSPKRSKRAGKVVGFIDLSKIQQASPRRSESRRHHSRDEETPDVQPTLRHDMRRAMARADRGSRSTLSAAQLREREASRYLRRQRAAGGQRGRSQPRRQESFGSPHAGGTVKVEAPITIKQLAEALALKANQVLRKAFDLLGFGAVNINSLLDDETAQLLAAEFQVELSVVHEVEAEEALIEGLKRRRETVEEAELETRPPVLAFLGHVDHGKTTLIDKIRHTHVAEGEAGGITQHIGAYRVTTEQGSELTIIDTPGHAAFTAMRARGAKAVDVVVLVVASDAGVQPQTEEALAHARAAGTPVVVAMTKIDRPEANPQRVLEQLAALDLVPEAWGGPVGVVGVSGITGEGIPELLERVALEAELLELRCHRDGDATGVVLEAEVQQGRGIIAHLLIQDGTLRRGDVILAGEGYGRVRSIADDRGNILEEAGPSMPVEVTGLSTLPGVGEQFHVVEKLEQAKEVAEERARKNRQAELADRRGRDALALLQSGGEGPEQVNLIVRADVQGAAEVLRQALSEMKHEEVEVRVLQSGVGAVTENDILLASTSDATVIAFGVGVTPNARQAAERDGIEIRHYQVLYEVLDDIRQMMEGRLAPEIQEEVTGHAEIRAIFRSSRFGNIAGCYVLDGTISRDNRVRLIRDGKVVHTGGIASIRREKDDVRQVREGFECGILLKGYNDIREQDVIEAYRVTEKKRKLTDPVSQG